MDKYEVDKLLENLLSIRLQGYGDIKFICEDKEFTLKNSWMIDDDLLTIELDAK